MATTFTDNYQEITIVHDGTTYNVLKSDILGIHMNKTKARLHISLASGYVDSGRLYVPFSGVTSPEYNSIGLLHKYLLDIWKEPSKNYCEFLAEEGQRVFDCSPRITLTDSFRVEVDSSPQTSGLSRSGNIVTFDTAPGDGAHIVITK